MKEIHSISLPERFDFSCHQQFTKEYQEVLDEKSAKTIQLDFSRVNYLDSSALGMMVLLHRKASALNIKTSLRGARGTALDILNMANMKKLYQYD
ncbi:STAS domain-containing protein [Aliiglaciecola sp. CAU 1673]|uniref:STAS domain-containing protein n=1 Tax=Aliiglaciecola sp. CAU 1673 TaxID=3032595 RepID=UPI0023DB7835|nr:STAS domain-containing protein [Aliiglaciecola sp. CAU 1673]MDF2177092.1 STAS domain-containing protein [Aliiglaciecola sp. CAU 1673]